ncbi:MAG: type II secretion system F family protein [Thermoplasmata archaeon]|nr:type II secretion system F family protein [Thermoplasmata archaeon]
MNVIIVPGVMATVGLVRIAARASTGERARRLRRARRWRLFAGARGRLERALREADVDLQPEEVCELWAGSALGAIAIVYAVSPGLVVLVVPLVLGAGPMLLRIARGRADRRFTLAVPGGLEQVAAGLRGGASLGETLASMAAGPGVLAGDLRRVTSRTALGLGLAESLSAWPEDRPLPSVRSAAGALAMAVTVGGRAADALDGLAASWRERLGAVAEARALSAQARLSALVVGAAPVVYVAFAAVTDPHSIDVLVGTSSGRVCFALGLALEGAGALWMRHIVRDEP